MTSTTTSTLKPSDVLDRAAALIEPEGAWTQGTAARIRQNRATFSEDPEATCWCAVGAILKAVGGSPSDAYRDARRRLLVVAGTDRIGDWNDAPGRTQAEVVTALRKAADLARSDGQ